MYVHSHSPLSRGFQVLDIQSPRRAGWQGGRAEPCHTPTHLNTTTHGWATLLNQALGTAMPAGLSFWQLAVEALKSCLCSLSLLKTKLKVH